MISVCVFAAEELCEDYEWISGHYRGVGHTQTLWRGREGGKVKEGERVGERKGRKRIASINHTWVDTIDSNVPLKEREVTKTKHKSLLYAYSVFTYTMYRSTTQSLYRGQLQ